MTSASSRGSDLHQSVTDRILAALEQGVPPWICPWRRDREPGRQRNGVTRRAYRGINVLLTTMAGFGSTRWYTAPQAAKLGGAIPEGEPGTELLCWVPVVVPPAETPDGLHEPGRSYARMLVHTLYNASLVL